MNIPPWNMNYTNQGNSSSKGMLDRFLGVLYFTLPEVAFFEQSENVA